MDKNKERFKISVDPQEFPFPFPGTDSTSSRASPSNTSTVPSNPSNSPSSQEGPSRKGKKSLSKKKISLYKTEICKSFESSSFCSYGERCQFAHSLEELRDIERHPRYKTELCKTYTVHGSCGYGKRCCFIHAGPANDEDTDLQDARNLPGDWKAPGVLSGAFSEIDVSPVSSTQRCKGYSQGTDSHKGESLTKEEKEKLLLLSSYRERHPQRLAGNKHHYQQRFPFLANTPRDYVGRENSSSMCWAPAHQCFVFVDATCTIASFKALGKAPGASALLKRYSHSLDSS